MRKILELFRQDERWHELDKALTGAFERIKGDARNLYSWIKYFRQKELQNDARHESASRELAEHSAVIKGLQMELAMVKEELRNIHRMSQTSTFPNQIRTKYGLEGEPEQKDRFARKIIAISRPVKKDYIMQQIEQLIAKKTYTTKQIEAIITTEKMLCGRTAFYDYLREIRIRNGQASGRAGEITEYED
ncbi:hypothetical protein HYY74_03130 [Candidatus Woesearchaeota archaeon]|nr:hypothetical protein [Candidatus Woesearchaeota archaeon]